SLVLALSAPPVAMPALIALIVLGATPVIQLLLLDRNDTASLGRDEPWITLGFAFFATLIWLFRRRTILQKRREAAQAAQAELFKGFLRLLLGAQHLMNTPLQTIMANVRLIGMDFPDAEPRIKVIENALNMVRRVGLLITFSESQIRSES